MPEELSSEAKKKEKKRDPVDFLSLSEDSTQNLVGCSFRDSNVCLFSKDYNKALP